MAEQLVSTQVKKEMVKKQKVFANLNDNEIDVLVTLLVEKKFAPGDVIVTEGDRVDSVFLIISGTADVTVSRLEDHQKIVEKVATLTNGSAIGLSEQGFYSLTGLRTATVTAATEMVTLKLSVVVFRGFALAYPHASEVMRRQAESL